MELLESFHFKIGWLMEVEGAVEALSTSQDLNVINAGGPCFGVNVEVTASNEY